MAGYIEIFNYGNSEDLIEMEREGKYINLKKSDDSKKYFRFNMVSKCFERVNHYKTIEDKATEVKTKNITGWFKSCKIITKDKKFARLVVFNKYHYDFQNYRSPVRFVEMLGNTKSTYLEQWESLGVKFDDVEEWFKRIKDKTNYWYRYHSIRINYPPSAVSKSLMEYIKKQDSIKTSQLNDLVLNFNNGEYKILNELIDREKTPQYANVFDMTTYYGDTISLLTAEDYRAKIGRNNLVKIIQNYHLDLDSFCEWLRYQKFVEKNNIDYITDHYGDYLRMELALKNGHRSKITKYPKHFRDYRQRTIVEFKAHEEEISELAFKNVVDMHKKLEYETKMFSIVLPETTEDIVHEANELKHCVRSYIKPMSRNETLICFCRFTKSKDEPFVTIEVKRGAVTQAYTKNDKKPPEKALDFITKWANKKKLTIAWCW